GSGRNRASPGGGGRTRVRRPRAASGGWGRWTSFASSVAVFSSGRGPGLHAPRVARLLALRRGEDLVELAAVAEVPLLRLRPGAEGAIDGHQLHLREARHVGRIGVLRMARAVVVLRRDALAFRRVQELQV